ncbi:pyridoxamine 5'-phosphate oxidase family protein [Nocardia cyriacigeorgica]|uniref:pyridoxamine 5'-phosphate oxidase family protein n=1 Tax=Nocardia cyriacigeorgica TaxID=135487 RepID=UPI0024549CFA|nr:pyridoxamine 5'-phosphate oxidase family protein [Nocardia cyriacigeorgica]
MIYIDEDMRRIVDRTELAFVATVRPDHSPSVSPKGSVRVYDDQHLVFMDIASPGTVANLAQNPGIDLRGDPAPLLTGAAAVAAAGWKYVLTVQPQPGQSPSDGEDGLLDHGTGVSDASRRVRLCEHAARSTGVDRVCRANPRDTRWPARQENTPPASAAAQ